MAAAQPSKKQQLINDANKKVIITTSVATFVVIFTLVAAHSLIGQLMYQNRIMTAKKQALSQLKEDTKAVAQLKTSYKAFVSSPQNVIGGNNPGGRSNDGDNAKIVLDALPSKYDFPALATSLETLLARQHLTVGTISGTDDEVAQSAVAESATPQAVPIPFTLSGGGSYADVKGLTTTLSASIRPIQIKTMTLSGGDGDMLISLTAQTYYQPAKIFKIDTKVVK